MKSLIKNFGILFVFLLVFIPLSAGAFELRKNNDINVGPQEIIDGNLYALGNSLNIEGKVKGDVFFAGKNADIKGKIEGDLFCLSQSSINVSGEVGGSVRAASDTIILSGSVARNVQFFGDSLILNPNSKIGWDLLMAGKSGSIKGEVGGNFYGAITNAQISGKIHKNVQLNLGKLQRKNNNHPLTITDAAEIGGNVNYSSGNEAEISKSAKISGKINYRPPKTQQKNFNAWFYKNLFSVFAALVLALVLISLWRREVGNIINKMRRKNALALGWGVIIMFATPMLCFLLLFTIIGIPLAMILIALWIIAIYLGKILAGISIGAYIIKKIPKTRQGSLVWEMIVGITISWLIFSIPIIGWPLALLATWWGLGGIFLYFKNKN